MRKHFTLIACFFISLTCINAQTFMKSVGGSANDAANCIAQTTDGGFIMAGDTYSFGLTKSDVLITKFDATGNLLWNKRCGSSDYDHVFCITATTDGGCAVSGVSGGNRNYLIVIKLDASGNLEWSKFYSASTRNGAHSIIQTPEGGFVIGGYAETYDNGSWGYVLKTDFSGNVEWSKRIFDRSYYPAVQTLVVTKDSGYAFTANETAGGAYYDIFLIKLDKTGKFKWAKSVGGISTDMPTGLIETADGGFAVTGFTFDIESTPQYQFMYILKTDKDGNLNFSKRIKGENSDNAKTIAETEDGNILISGSIPSVSGSYANFFVSEINGEGKILWTKTVSSDTASFQATKLIRTSAGDYAAAGITGKNGSNDFLLMRFDSNFSLCGAANAKRKSEDFGELADRVVTVSNANTSVFNSGFAVFEDELIYNSLCDILPVKLTAFTAITEKNNMVSLQWKTTEEINSSFIEIYRSNDGKNYSLLTKLPAKNALGGSDYNYLDNTPFTGTNYYKLKFIDKDGKYSFSDVKTANINKAFVRIFPNPVKDWLHVQLNNNTINIKLKIYSADARLVLEKTITSINADELIDVRKLAAGTYSLNIIEGNTRSNQIFIKN